MCELGEMVLSDVHVNMINVPSCEPMCELNEGQGQGQATTRFYFRIPGSSNLQICQSVQSHSIQQNNPNDKECTAISNEPQSDNHPVTMATTVDEDGDFIVARRRTCSDEKGVIVIDHSMATMLNDVGQQVWLGCMVLCDFLLTHRDMFRDRVVLELGAGVGLASIVMSTIASHVIATDVGQSILEMCQRNISRNCYHLRDHLEVNKDQNIVVKELDWCRSVKTNIAKGDDGQFHWGDKDREKLEEVIVVLAADVVYEDTLTDAFFSTLKELMTFGKDKTAFIALEKRLNFTLEDLDVTCKAYDHFRQRITALIQSSNDSSDFEYSVEQLPLDFPQCFQYERTKQLIHLDLDEITEAEVLKAIPK